MGVYVKLLSWRLSMETVMMNTDTNDVINIDINDCAIDMYDYLVRNMQFPQLDDKTA